MTISRRLTRGFLLISLLTCVVGFFGMRAAQGITREFQEVADEILPTIQLLEKMRFAGLRVVSSTSEFVFLQNEMRALPQGEPASDDEESLIVSGRSSFGEAFTRYHQLSAGGHAHENARMTDIRRQFELLEKSSAEIVAVKKRGVAGEPVLELKELFEAQETAFLQLVDATIAHKYRELEAGKASVYASARAAVKVIVAVTLLLFAAALLVGGRIARSITAPLEQLCRATNEIGMGRLNTRISPFSPAARQRRENDEVEILIGNFNRMAAELENFTVNRGHLDCIIESMEAGLIVTSAHGKGMRSNQAACALLGYDRDELVGQPAAAFYPSLAALRGAAPAGSGGGEPVRTDDRAALRRKDGRKVDVRLSVSLLCDEFGRQDGHVFLLQGTAS